MRKDLIKFISIMKMCLAALFNINLQMT
ncbi:hypothetical protein NPIL_487041, partial [Nephila pilipes]